MEALLEKVSEQAVNVTFQHNDMSFPPRLPIMVEMRVLTCYLPSVRHMLFWAQPSLTTVVLLGFCSVIAENARVRLQYAMELDDQLWCLSSRTYTPVLETIQLHGLREDHFLQRRWLVQELAIYQGWSNICRSEELRLVDGDGKQLFEEGFIDRVKTIDRLDALDIETSGFELRAMLAKH